MTINPHDDYESLAKLLYPSIEASGNVYYGQTRKLAIDELFDKNNNGFESYFCSCKKEDNSSQYALNFHWELGPFSDTVKIVDTADTYKDYPLAWLKYSLTKKETEHTNVLSSGEYSTYEVDYDLGQPTLYCSLEGLLPDGNMYNNSNFFLDEKAKILYVLLYKAPVYEDMDKPLYIEALTGNIEVSLVNSGSGDWYEEQLEQCAYKYGYSYSNQDEDLQLVRTTIELKQGNRVYFKCDNRPELSLTHFLRFNIYSENENAEVAVGGNIESMAKLENSEMLANAYHGLFSDNRFITDASKLYIDKISSNGCRYLFSNCSRLKTAPAILPCFELKTGCFHNMFTNCSELEMAPVLPARNGVMGCYWRMFECVSDTVVSKLNRVVCLLNQWQHSYTPDWLDGRSGIEIHALSNSNWDTSDESVLPPDSNVTYLDSVTSNFNDKVIVSNKPIEKYLVTHGTNNKDNGRGDITDPSTLANMEKSFDENNGHPMNTYNADGSFNQEIWGYKSFCSPVQFRNGIYGEEWSILSTYESGNTGTYVEYIETGSVIKHEKSDDLKIELINRKSHNTEDGIDFEDNTFLVPLHGCKNSEKDISCRAELRSISDYDFNNESCTFTSSISNYTKGPIAQSRIETIINADGRGTALAAADIRVANDEPEVILGVVDFRGGIVSSNLTISKSGSKFTGSVEADDVTAGDITTDNIYVDGTLHLGDAEISLDNDNLVISAPNSIAINTYTEMIGGLYVEGNFRTIGGLECGGDSSFMGVITADSGITSHGDITIDSGKKFVGDLDGVIPHVESFSSKTVPIGCIILIRIKSESSASAPLAVGSMLTSGNSSTYELSIGCFSETGISANNNSDPLAEWQTFRTLSQCVLSSNGIGHVLAIRVA